MSVLATDAFTRADAGNLGANWSIPTGFTAIAVVSNQAKIDNPSDLGMEYYNAVVWPNYQYAQIKLTALNGDADSGMGPAVRVQSSGSAYFCQGNTTDTRLYKVVGGTFTQLGPTAGACAVNDVLYIEVQGTSLTVKQNGSTIIGPVTDSDISTGNAGLWAFIAGNPAGDDWEGGDFGGGGGGGGKPDQYYRMMREA
jgi:hypothetical protein